MRYLTSVGVVSGDIDGLERIAAKATNAQVLGGGGAVMELRPDVIDGKRQRIKLIGYTAIFADVRRTRPNKLAKFAADRHY